eukprot:Skav229780  [mRNA]  locus=scaffold519:137999:139192:+ [translate_table: standard]
MKWFEDAEIHDVQFVREALKQVLQLSCLDKRRVHCTGYSNGGRFCMRLASEMSDVIASVAPVSGLRFPDPNHATRPIPILAFHGAADPVNPFGGNGHAYWQSSVPHAMQAWAKLNQCQSSWLEPKFLQEAEFSVASYTGCKDNAKVQVIKLHGAGHQWPGATFSILGVGAKSNVDANRMIFNFFAQHRLPKYIEVNNVGLAAAIPEMSWRSPSRLEPFLVLLGLGFLLASATLVAIKSCSGRRYVRLENSSTP